MAYELLATGIKSAQPLDAYIRGVESRQNEQINQVNIEAGKKRNELAGFELEKARKQVQAEKAWAQIPVGEDGSRDPAAVAAVEKISPDYVRTQKQAEIQLHRDELGQTLAELETASFLVSKAKTPDELQAALAKAKEVTGVDISPDEAGVLGFTNAAKSFADEAKAWDDAYKNAKTPEEARLIKAHVDARAAEEAAGLTLAQLKIQSEQTKISANIASANKSNAQAEAARAKTNGNAPISTAQQRENRMAADARDKRTKTVNKNLSALESSLAKADVVIGMADRGISQSNVGNTGIVGQIPGYKKLPNVTDLRETLATIKSNIGFEELKNMRFESPTGGALGQVAVQELKYLQATVASAEQDQSEEQLDQNLGAIKEKYQSARDKVNQAIIAEREWLQQQNDEELNALLEKY